MTSPTTSYKNKYLFLKNALMIYSIILNIEAKTFFASNDSKCSGTDFPLRFAAAKIIVLASGYRFLEMSQNADSGRILQFEMYFGKIRLLNK